MQFLVLRASLCASLPAALGAVWWCSQPQTGISMPTQRHRGSCQGESVQLMAVNPRRYQAVTLSLHFSWAVDWQDSQRCRSSLNPSSQGPSVFLQNHTTPVGRQTSILSPCKGISVFFYLTNFFKKRCLALENWWAITTVTKGFWQHGAATEQKCSDSSDRKDNLPGNLVRPI